MARWTQSIARIGPMATRLVAELRFASRRETKVMYELFMCFLPPNSWHSASQSANENRKTRRKNDDRRTLASCFVARKAKRKRATNRVATTPNQATFPAHGTVPRRPLGQFWAREPPKRPQNCPNNKSPNKPRQKPIRQQEKTLVIMPRCSLFFEHEKGPRAAFPEPRFRGEPEHRTAGRGASNYGRPGARGCPKRGKNRTEPSQSRDITTSRSVRGSNDIRWTSTSAPSRLRPRPCIGARRTRSRCAPPLGMRQGEDLPRGGCSNSFPKHGK